jgi:hypothetical protein
MVGTYYRGADKRAGWVKKLKGKKMTRVITQSEKKREEGRSKVAKQDMTLESLALLPVAFLISLLGGYLIVTHFDPSTTHDRSNFIEEVEAAVHLWHMVLAFVCVLCLGYIASVIVEWHDRKEKSTHKKETMPPLRRSERIKGMKIEKGRWKYILKDFV